MGSGQIWWQLALRKVIMHHHKKSIKRVLEEAGIKQGLAEMIKSYQKAINTIMKSLTAKEIQEAEELAIEWTEWQPPWGVQSDHDSNDELGHGKLFQDLEDCWDKFVKYAWTAFGSGSTEDDSANDDAAP
ncbi:hypothetical protein BKA82DRAFT_4009581 [Pisolithus tinctorius]|nr:hypothetical protein BKA82DRAFT_4009581 [Pisolithus tinctorius]